MSAQVTAATLRHTSAAHTALTAATERGRGPDAARLPGPPGPKAPTDLHRLDLLTASADAAARTAAIIAACLESIDPAEADCLNTHIGGMDAPAAWAWSAGRTADGQVPEPVADQIADEALGVLVPIVRHLGGHPSIPALMACPRCRCLTVAARPSRPEILTCTNPHCSPAPLTWALRSGQWWTAFPELLR